MKHQDIFQSYLWQHNRILDETPKQSPAVFVVTEPGNSKQLFFGPKLDYKPVLSQPKIQTLNLKNVKARTNIVNIYCDDWVD